MSARLLCIGFCPSASFVAGKDFDGFAPRYKLSETLASEGWGPLRSERERRILVSACQKSIFDKLSVGEANSPAGRRGLNFQFEPWLFSLWRSRKICMILRRRPPSPIFARAAAWHKQKLQGSVLKPERASALSRSHGF